MSEEELNSLESALRGLTPAAPALDRDALMYQAGKWSAAQRSWPWPVATAASWLVAVSFGLAFWTRAPELRIVERVVYRTTPAPAPAPVVEEPKELEGSIPATVASPWEPAGSRYDQLRDNVLRWGLDGLPPAPRTRPETVSADDLLHPL